MDTKSKKILVSGFVIKEELHKDYDKKLTLLTNELGKIFVYAHGVRRVNSKNLNTTTLFSYCDFELAINNDFYVLSKAVLKQSFYDLTNDYDNVIIGSYFLEVLNFVSFENIESNELNELLKYALKALIRNKMDKSLIKATFEIKLLYLLGLISDIDENQKDSELVKWTYKFVINTTFEKLFSFDLIESEKINFIKKSKLLIINNLDFKSKII